MTISAQNLYKTKSRPPANLMQQVAKKKVLLIDDDMAFRALVVAQAQETSTQIVALESLSQLGEPKKIKEYDAIILDYYLERLNGLQVAQYIDAFFPRMPVILISAYGIFESQESWPQCVKGFFSKDEGVSNLLNYTESFLEVFR